MNIKKAFFPICAFAIAGSVMFTSCGSNSDQQNVTDADTTAVDSTEVEPMEDSISYTLPSPLQIALIFKRSGLKYKAGITHDAKKQNDYATSYKQSIALGVYSSDLAYCVLNKEKQEAINYMNAVKAMSDKLGMSSVFDSESLLKRFETNITVEDSVMDILSDIQSKSDDFFSSNDRQMNAAIVFSGAWTESMYIASKVGDADKKKNLPVQLADQLGILQNLVKELKKHEAKDENIAKLVTELSAIETLILAIPGVTEMMASETPSEVKINATDAQLKELSAKLDALRATMIAN